MDEKNPGSAPLLVWKLLAAATFVAVLSLVLAGCAAAPAPARLPVTGDLAAHDPALVAGLNGAPWYVYSTGDASVNDGTISIRTSKNGIDWTLAGTVWKKIPAWLTKAVPGVSNLWAPELFQHGRTWYLYYAASTFGSNRSVIGLATNTTLDQHARGYKWVDRGPVIASQKSDDFNAIDPAITVDAHGTPWMAFGSFWSGIKMIRLAWPTGKRVGSGEPLAIADRGSPPDAIEASTIIRHDGAFFLVVSKDFCCQGSGSTYYMTVGRATSVTGPYLDESGKPMLKDGGTVLLRTRGAQVGPGGESYSNGYLAWHFYNSDVGGATTLAIQKLGWTKAGWPTLTNNP